MGNLKFAMRAEIGDSDDAKTLERFQALLRSYNALLLRQSWGLGVEIHDWAIDGQKLTVFSDA